MDYTQSDAYVTHVGTGHRMHQDTAPITTEVSAADMNAMTWSLMELLNAAGEAPTVFDPSVPATYQGVLRAIFGRLASFTAGKGADLVGTEAGITLQAYLRGYLYMADLVGDGVTDNTARINAWLVKAAAGNRRLLAPVGQFCFNDTLLINSTVEIAGCGIGKTVFIFINAVAGKSAFKYVTGCIRTRFVGLSVWDGTFGKSCGLELTDSIAAGGNVQKLEFTSVEVSGFATGLKFTSADPLNGATHAMCSETVFLHCRFVNNQLAILNQNCQAYNNRFIGCDIENFDTTYRGSPITDASFVMISDEAGGGIYLEGGSYIGRGKLYRWKYPTGGSVLWSGATFSATNIRIEARSTHNGVIINEEVHGVTGSLALNLDLKNIDITTSGQDLDLLRYGGRVNGRIENVFPTAGTGTLTVRQYPTLGRTSNTNTASQGGIELVDHSLFRAVETSSPYGGGGWAASATGRLTSHGARSSSTNSGMSVDAQGFFFLTGPGDAQQLGMQLNGLTSASKLIWNNDLVTSGFAGDIKLIMPKGGRPLKLIAYKHATQFAANVGFKLYLVKDNAAWANPAAFAVGTDALLVASIPTTAGAAGYYEIPCVLVANSLGNDIKSGAGSWTEGRMLLEKVGGATLFPGWVGVEYM